MGDARLQFGDYEVLSLPDGSPALLGEGTSGATYKAVQRETVFGRTLETFAALKVIKAGRLEDEAAKDQFFRELKVLSRIHHPNVVRYLRQGRTSGADGVESVWFAMEYCGGGSLQDYARGRGGIPETELVPLAAEAAAGLRAVHEAGFAHCDIKPANLLLDLQPGRRTPVVKLSDFGSVQEMRAMDRDGVAEGMLSGEPFRGSVLYASPEQLKGHRLDARSDIYSLGISLWHLLLGDRPFLGDLPEVQRWHLGKEPHEPFLPSLLHPGFRRLLASMVEKNPALRPAGMGEVEAALLAVQGDLAARPATVAAPQAAAEEKLEDRYEVDYGRRVPCPMGNRFPARRVADGRELELLFVHAEQAARPEVQAQIRQAVERLGGAGPPAAVAAPLEARRFGDDLVVACLPAGRATLLDFLKRRGGTLPVEEAVALLAPVARAADFLQTRRLTGLSLRVNDIHVRMVREDGSALSDSEVEQSLGQAASQPGVQTQILVDPLRVPPQGGPGMAGTQVTMDGTGTLSGTVKSSGLPSASDNPRVGFAALLYRLVVGHEVPETVFLTPDAFTPTQRLGGESNALLRDVLARTLNPLPSCAALLREVCEHDGLPEPALAIPDGSGTVDGWSSVGTGSMAATASGTAGRMTALPIQPAQPTPSPGPPNDLPAVTRSSGQAEPPIPRPTPPPVRRPRWPWAAAAAVLVAVAVFVPGSPLRKLFVPSGPAPGNTQAVEARFRQVEAAFHDADEIDGQIAGADDDGVAALRTRLAGLEPIPELAGRVAGLKTRLDSRSKDIAADKKRLDERQAKIDAARHDLVEIDGQVASADEAGIEALRDSLAKLKPIPEELAADVAGLESKLAGRPKQLADEKVAREAERDRKAVDDWKTEALRRLAELESVDASPDFPTAAAKLAKLEQIRSELPKAPDLDGIEDARKVVAEKLESWRANWQQLQATEAPPPEKPFDLKGIFPPDLPVAGEDPTTRRGALAMAQKKLKEAGLYEKPVDGDPGRSTHDALIEFQRRNNLPPTARLDQATWQKFGLAATTPEEMREEGKKYQQQAPRRRTQPVDDDRTWFRRRIWDPLIKSR